VPVVYLRNAWYAATWERDIGSTPVGLTVLGEHVVVYRTASGHYAALADECAHRKTPLSIGRVVGEHLECGYHGMRYDDCGACVSAPTNGTVPPGVSVRSYPVTVKYGLVWIWMGDPHQSRTDDVFPVEHWMDPAWGTTDGDDMVVACNYLYLVDNLLDPSHVAWVHPGSFSGEGVEDTPMETTIGDHGVTVWRWMLDAAPAPFYAPYLPFSGNTDRKQQYEVRYPCNALVQAYFCPASTGGEDRPLPADCFIMHSYNFLTPIDERTTRYFWFQQRNVHPSDDEVSRQFAASVRAAFAEDKAVLEQLQRGVDRSTTPFVNLRSDSGGVRFRRRLTQLIDSESADTCSLP
jgi:vanillate O-demethylase monooxygenase subunit